MRWNPPERLQSSNCVSIPEGGKRCGARARATPIEGKRYYHGLQASLLRARAAPCLLRCLSRRRIKSVDALLVGCDSECEPGTTWALAAQKAFGTHAGGSEKAAIDARLRARPLRSE